FFHQNGRFLTFQLMTTTLFIDHFARKLENLASSSAEMLKTARSGERTEAVFLLEIKRLF
ncbi:hypothetical protein ACUOCP_28025, partial [Escherichia sp. R-CC3]